VVEAVLADYTTAPIEPKLRAMLGFLAKITRAPGEVSAADAKAVIAEGVSPKAFREALFVAALFNTIDRLADAFRFEVPDAASFEAAAKQLLRFGYQL